ncbi:hypothetical protein AB205_0047710, partial [Aquarana catesbeiana]
LCGTFVPCILACKIASDYGECCCLPILGGATLAMRTGIRERYHIPVRVRLSIRHKVISSVFTIKIFSSVFFLQGSICNDWVRLVFCGPCALCQMARELKARK